MPVGVGLPRRPAPYPPGVPTRHDPPATAEVRRIDDGELLGSVRRVGDEWLALTVFGGVLGRAATEAEARVVVERDGLASLQRRWFYRPAGSEEWEVVLIQEAWPGRPRVVLGPHALPGVATIEIASSHLEAGTDLTLEPPNEDLAQFA